MKALINYLSNLAGGVFAGMASIGPDDAYPESRKGRRQKTTIVGIFNNARDLDRALERLAREGFEDTVYDEAIVGEEPVNVGTPVFAPGDAPPVVWGSAEPAAPRKPDLHTVVRAFKAHLADYHLPADVIEAYATTLYHNGEFVLVKTDPERAEQAVEILRECGAIPVNRRKRD